MKKILSLIGISLVSVSVLAACGEANIEKDNTPKTEKVEKKEATQKLKIGETVNFDGIKVTLNSVRIQQPGQFDNSQKGQFVVVNLTAENTTDKEQIISSLANVELFDKDGYKYSTTILTEGIQGQFDGQVVSGGTLRGEIPFDVPVSDSYELHFSNPFKTGKAIWTISASDIAK